MPLVPSDHRSTEGLGSRPGAWLPFSSTRLNTARYDPGLSQIHVIFRDGSPWVYDQVPRNVWRNFRRATSAGRYINRVLNGYPYFRGSFSYAGHRDTTDAEEVEETTTPPTLQQRIAERREAGLINRPQFTNW